MLRDEHVGELWPAGEPAEDPVMYGHATMTPTGAFEARSYQTFTLTYTAGRYGVDDTGSLRVVFRWSSDFGQLQMDDAGAANYVTAKASNATPLRVSFAYDSLPRPRYHGLTVTPRGGFLREGDTICIVFGDATGGSPGMSMQTCCEHNFEFKVLLDACATGYYTPIPDTPTIAIVPGPPAHWKAVLPTARRTGESFSLGIKAEDKWGNPTAQARGLLVIKTNMPVAGLPDQIDFPTGERALRLDKLTVAQPGTLRLSVESADGTLLTVANALVVSTDQAHSYWGDLHGQSGESVGINTARDFFSFARDLAFLDATAHQANDFQVNNTFWAHLNELTGEFHEDRRFVVFPGYEWSGNTAVGGDRNVYFRTEGRPIRRSSHALLVDRSDIHSDSPTAADLFRDITDEDCVVYAHCGGRYADMYAAHDPRLETSMEIHSAWGSFEWLLGDCFDQGFRCGVVCNSDGHKGRPGASYPGASSFAAYGGLTCFITDDLTRDGLFDCLRQRHTYGTTGNRLHLDVRARFSQRANFFARDPKAYDDATSTLTSEVMMGDIVQTDEASVELLIEVAAGTPIERIEVLNGKDVVATLRGYTREGLGKRLRVLWSGAEYRGRGNRTRWRGTTHLAGAEIIRIARINNWNIERMFEQRDAHTVVWEGITAGNFGGMDLWYSGDDEGAQLRVTSNIASASFKLNELGLDDHRIDAGGLDRHLRVFRLPEHNTCLAMSEKVSIQLKATGDNPLWVRVTTEDGFNAWSSPIYVFR